MLSLIESVLFLVNSLGYLGIFIGMTLESTIVPVPSELILIPAGTLVARGEMSFFPIFFAGVFGSILGALINYHLALFLGRRTINFLVNKYGSFLFLNEKNLERTDVYFKNHGEATTFIGRLIPVARHLISIPAGFAKMNIYRFIIFTALGAGTWTAVLIFVGYFFGTDAQPILKVATGMLLILSMVFALIYYLRQKNNKKKK